MERISSLKPKLFGVGVAILVILSFAGEGCKWCFSLLGIGIKMAIIGAVIVVFSFDISRRLSKADSLIYKIGRQPVVNVNSAVDGLPIAIEGKIRASELLESPYTKTKCVFYHYIYEEYIQTKDSSRWETLLNECNYKLFEVEDKTGRIIVDLKNVDSSLSPYRIVKRDRHIPDFENSEVDCVKLFHQKVLERKKWWIFPIGPLYRVSEYVLLPEQEVFVYGYATVSNNKKRVGEFKDIPLIVSRKSKEAYMEDFGKGENLPHMLNLALIISATLIYFPLYYLFKVHLAFYIAAIALILFRAVYLIFNRIIELRNRCRNSLSNIDVELQRRATLIPALVDIVVGYARHEKEIMESIAKARVIFSGEWAERFGRYDRSIHELRKLFAIAENYPKLMANKQFLEISQKVSETEERIAYSREFYNKTVTKYNTLIQMFPFSVIAFFAGAKPKGYYKITEK